MPDITRAEGYYQQIAQLYGSSNSEAMHRPYMPYRPDYSIPLPGEYFDSGVAEKLHSGNYHSLVKHIRLGNRGSLDLAYYPKDMAPKEEGYFPRPGSYGIELPQGHNIQAFFLTPSGVDHLVIDQMVGLEFSGNPKVQLADFLADQYVFINRYLEDPRHPRDLPLAGRVHATKVLVKWVANSIERGRILPGPLQWKSRR
jgi:hypothetical protein